jgi:starch phosphorylase
MKVLVNGGLNLSELDGWWAEAYSPEVGWAIGDGRERLDPDWDAVETEQLFALLERQVIPEFYDRDADGIPRAWVARIRASLARLTPRFSSNRMLAEYLDRLYLPATESYRRRADQNLKVARELRRWMHDLHHHWAGIHWGHPDVVTSGGRHRFSVPVYLAEIHPDSVSVELYAEPRAGNAIERHPLRRDRALTGAAGGFLYVGDCPAVRPSDDYTPRVVPAHPEVAVPLEARFIAWYPA